MTHDLIERATGIASMLAAGLVDIARREAERQFGLSGEVVQWLIGLWTLKVLARLQFAQRETQCRGCTA